VVNLHRLPLLLGRGFIEVGREGGREGGKEGGKEGESNVRYTGFSSCLGEGL